MFPGEIRQSCSGEPAWSEKKPMVQNISRGKSYRSATDSNQNEAVQKVRSIYKNGDCGVANEVTNLLVDVLREGDHSSHLALRQFLGIPVLSATQSDVREVDRVLIARVRVFIDEQNAHIVETWLSSYESSTAGSVKRSLLESMLRGFVMRRYQVEAMKCRLAESIALKTNAASICAALKAVIERISNRQLSPPLGLSD